MAIYSLHHSSVGKISHAVGTAGAHLQYILRDHDDENVITHKIPKTANNARTHFNQIESRIRKNGRVLDKVMVALPCEASPVERADMVDRYCRRITDDRCGWLAALHDNTDDAKNPHAHIVFRDEDLETGKRFLFVSDSPRDRGSKGLTPKFTDYLREEWEHEVNRTLQMKGVGQRVSRKTLADQDIERKPQIHIGPNAQHVERFVDIPRSSEHDVMRWGKTAKVDYPAIDAGRTRAQYNASIIDLDLERRSRSEDPITRAWATFEKDQLSKDRSLIERHGLYARRFTLKERRIKQAYGKNLVDIKSRRKNDIYAARQKVRQTYGPDLYEMNERHKAQMDGFTAKESTFWRKALLLVDFTGGVKRNRQTAKNALQDAHKRENGELNAQATQLENKLRMAIVGQYSGEIQLLRSERKARLDRFYDSHHERQQRENKEWFTRDTERETARVELEQQLEMWRQNWDQEPSLERDFD